MTRSISMDVGQTFDVHPVTASIFSFIPKIRGYWLLVSAATRLLPWRWAVGTAHVTLGAHTVSVPIDLRDPYQIDVYAKDKQELCVPAIIAKLIPADGVFLDVGANCGWYSRIISRVLSPSDGRWPHPTA